MTVKSNLKQLATGAAASQRSLPTFGRRLAEALAWGSGQSSLRELGDPGINCRVTQGMVADERAALFFGHTKSDVNDRLLDAARYAYHASVDWCVLTNTFETRIFNSHWIYRKDWFALPPIPRSRLGKTPILQALTPDDVVNGNLDEAAVKVLEPESQLIAVDDALFVSLDAWRNQAFRFAPSAAGVDEQLHNLFVQLFVLRVVEDKKQVKNLTPLLDAVTSPDSVSHEILEKIFAEARRHIQGELFEGGAPLDVPEFVIAGIIRDLYYPKHLPDETATYNFAWIDPDILGRAYEKYVSTILSPARVSSAQMHMFHEPHRDIERVSKRKSYGIYYTPSYIARFLADASLRKLNESSPITPTSIPRVIDIACGSGSFLAAAMDTVVKMLRAHDPARNWGRVLIEKQKILGIDIDRRAVNIAQLSLWLRLVQEPKALPLPALERCVVAGDSLRDEVFEKLPENFDVILGNPPFLATGDVPTRDQLSQRFQTAQGRFDYSSLFVERSIEKLRDGGTLGLVIPNRLFVNRDAAAVRALITTKMRLVTIVDFGSLEIFLGTSAYIGLVVAQKVGVNGSDRPARFINVRAVPPRLPGAYLFDGAFGELRKTRFIEAFAVAQPSDDRPWAFLSPETKDLIAKLSLDSRRLADVADVFQGIKTGANDLLVVEQLAGTRGHLVQIQNALGETAFVERELLMPVVFGSDIQRYVPIVPSRFLIYPYVNGQVLHEDTLERDWPGTYAYLRLYETILKGRSSVIQSGLRWYELVRKRDEKWLRARKLLMRDLAPAPAFTLDDVGSTFLIGGTAVVPTDDTFGEALLGFLNSGFIAWYLDQKTPAFRGGYRKFEVQHLTDIPVPTGLFSDEIIDVVARLARDAAMFHAANPISDSVSPAEAEIDRIIESLLPEGQSARVRTR